MLKNIDYDFKTFIYSLDYFNTYLNIRLIYIILQTTFGSRKIYVMIDKFLMYLEHNVV
jgi:hypothetical protein